MEIFLLITVGLAGGVLGGMGMGGGTLLIPLLTIFCNTPQHLAQSANLISFVPMALIALIIHFKNKLIDFKKILWMLIPAVAAAGAASFFAQKVPAEILKKIFGGFILLLGIIGGVGAIKTKKQDGNNPSDTESDNGKKNKRTSKPIPHTALKPESET